MDESKTVVVLFGVLAITFAAYFVVFGSPPANYEYDTNNSAPHDCTDAYLSSPDTNGTHPFTDVSQKVGFRYESEERNGLEGVNNASVYVNDYNNDGMSDLLAIGCAKTMLFENEGGEYGVSGALPDMNITATAALFFDYDNDGWEDLLLLPKYTDPKGEPVFLENHEGEFSEREEMFDVELNATRGATAADYTGNGCLDVFIVQAGNWEKNRPMGYGSTTETNATASETLGNGGQNRLFAGDCRGFEEMTEEAGIWGRSWSLAASFVDLTNDGYPDIHVANDFNNDVVYINEGDGTFDRRVLPDSTNRNGMSSEVADVNGDGYLDIFVTNIHSVIAGENSHLSISGYRVGGRITGNNLLINQGNGTFVDRAEEYGVQVGGWGWGAEFADFDNDMRQELVHGTFFGIPSMGATSVLWDRNGSGYEYVNSSAAGLETSRSWGIATADFDSDGMLDLVESNLEGNVSLYENRLDLGNWIEVAVDGGNRTEIGTRVYVEAKDREQMRVVSSRSGYMSQSSSILHFGLDNATRVDIHVEWPDGETEIYSDVEANQRVYIRNNRSNVGSFTKST